MSIELTDAWWDEAAAEPVAPLSGRATAVSVVGGLALWALIALAIALGADVLRQLVVR